MPQVLQLQVVYMSGLLNGLIVQRCGLDPPQVLLVLRERKVHREPKVLKVHKELRVQLVLKVL